ncbi:MAG: DUF72 domain-containing protein [Candidatus Korarchaeum sp.]|nr:DUF72 domain-containing protein [Candidatus Korarchaeum sp.]MDW8034917.1 DUF72 domain-containing protein [Candidatus Korarchaeum sp.]
MYLGPIVERFEVKIGCCGFQISKKKYAEIFDVVEIQDTFYKLPSLEILRRWRKDVGKDSFEFSVKAWMLFTHNPSATIWRKAGLPPDADYGSLRPTKKNLESWERFKEVIRELNSSIVIFQSPPSFKATDENTRNAREFFGSISGDVVIGWEVRDESWFKSEGFRRILDEFRITHVVDPIYESPVHGEFRYYRLHGSRKDSRIIYSYKYSEEELLRLADLVKRSAMERNYVLFNNAHFSLESAKSFKKTLAHLR